MRWEGEGLLAAGGVDWGEVVVGGIRRVDGVGG